MIEAVPGGENHDCMRCCRLTVVQGGMGGVYPQWLSELGVDNCEQKRALANSMQCAVGMWCIQPVTPGGGHHYMGMLVRYARRDR